MHSFVSRSRRSAQPRPHARRRPLVGLSPNRIARPDPRPFSRSTSGTGVFCRVFRRQGKLIEHLGYSSHRSLHTFEQGGHVVQIGSIRDLESGELRIFDDSRHQILARRLGGKVDAPRHLAMAAKDALLETPARGLGRFAIRQVGEQQDKAQHAAGRGEDWIRSHEHSLRLPPRGLEPRFASPRLAVSLQRVQFAARVLRISKIVRQLVDTLAPRRARLRAVR